MSLFIPLHCTSGTGKSETGAHLAYAFARRNKVAVTELKQCVLYCGPSNKAVNVVLGKQSIAAPNTLGDRSHQTIR